MAVQGRFKPGWRQRFASPLVFTVLAAIAIWGHQTHWSFGHSPESDEDDETAAAREIASAALTFKHDPARGQIELSSARMVAQLGIKLVEAQTRHVANELNVMARVCYDQTRIARLNSRVAGTVWRVEKHVGQSIRQGEVLAIIDSMQVGSAKADLLTALADVEAKQPIHRRLEAIEKGVLPIARVEMAGFELRKARFELYNAEQTLINLGLPVDRDKLTNLADEQLVRHVNLLGLPESITHALDSRTPTANLLPLVAPFDGIMIGQDIVQGEVVSTSGSGVEIADVSHMLIKLSVGEEDAGQLRVGQLVTFKAFDAEVMAPITWISTEVDAKTRNIEARCLAANPHVTDEAGQRMEQRLLRANMFGTARVRVAEKPAAVVVPTEAIQWTGTSHVVFVQTSEKVFEMRTVEVGIEANDMTEVLMGVLPGELVATAGSHVLKSEAHRAKASAGA